MASFPIVPSQTAMLFFDFFMDKIFPVFARVRTVDQAVAQFATASV